MITLTPAAQRQVRALRDHYEELDRPDAVRGLRTALSGAWDKIVANPAVGSAAPRPYPQLARPGRLWISSGRYWIAYGTSPEPAIVGVFYETADIPRRI